MKKSKASVAVVALPKPRPGVKHFVIEVTIHEAVAATKYLEQGGVLNSIARKVSVGWLTSPPPAF